MSRGGVPGRTPPRGREEATAANDGNVVQRVEAVRGVAHICDGLLNVCPVFLSCLCVVVALTRVTVSGTGASSQFGTRFSSGLSMDLGWMVRMFQCRAAAVHWLDVWFCMAGCRAEPATAGCSSRNKRLTKSLGILSCSSAVRPMRTRTSRSSMPT